ncbi:hypothetical protein JTB14_005413 [Gonioctena quinquepunctata]|nr:hypothetical protein JTB14_005413 [Gonioctena quinquepunctata]
MKTIFCFSFLLAVVALVQCVSVPKQEPEYNENVKSAREKCQASEHTQINEEIEEKLFEQNEPVHRNDVEHHAICMVVELGYMKQSGEILEEKLKHDLLAIIKDETELNKWSHCTDRLAEPGESAMNIFQCFYDAMREHHPHYSEFHRSPLKLD